METVEKEMEDKLNHFHSMGTDLLICNLLRLVKFASFNIELKRSIFYVSAKWLLK
jgi:hypothetical protein